MPDIAETFTGIYKNKGWGKGESVSGPGSTIAHTKQLRSGLAGLMLRYGVKRFLDAPCGDCNWICGIDFKGMGVKYMGMDIVGDLMPTAKQRIPSGVFNVGDITQDPLPEADIIMVRDCLVHFSYDMVDAAIRNIKASGIKYLLSTTFPGRENKDIVTGDWRPLDLEAWPFSMPKPIEYIKDHYPDKQFSDKCLALWEL